MNVKTYSQAMGVILLLLVVFGVLRIWIPGFLTVNEPPEIALHLVTGGLVAWAGLTAGGYSRFAKPYAQWFGALYLVLGFLVNDLPLGIHLDLGCNLAHLLLGAWGVYVGFMARPTMAMAK